MKKYLCSSMVVIGFFVSSAAGAAALLWTNVSAGLPELGIRRIAPDPLEASVLYASSEKRVYRSMDTGKTWKQVLSVRGASDAVNTVYVSRNGGTAVVYAATNQGVKVSRDAGKTWAWIYQGQNAMTGRVYALLPQKDGRLIVGTAQGLFQVSAKGERSAIETAPKTPIYSIIEADGKPGMLFVSSDQGLFHSTDGGTHWERGFAGHSSKEEEGQMLEQFDIEELSSRPAPPALIYFSPAQRVYAGNNEGLLESALDRVSWSALNGEGLAVHSVRCLAQSAKSFYAGTNKGVYRWNARTRSLEDISSGLEAGGVETLVYSPAEDAMYAAGDRGLYKLSHPDLFFDASGEVPIPDAGKLLQRFQNEPGIRQVQEAAIRYAEVSPEKIEAWRKAASRKALLPTLSVHGSENSGDNVDIDRGGTGDPDHFIIGPKEKSFDWYVGASWDLGDMIWNDAQTSIDTRSKLMVELRGDVLNEVTHLYYERRRLQAEMAMTPQVSLPLQTEKMIRLEELTAGIDALTGSFLSTSLAESVKQGEGHG